MAAEWWYDRMEIVDLAGWLDDRCELSTVEAVIYLFEKPWKWSPEREQMIRERNAQALEQGPRILARRSA